MVAHESESDEQGMTVKEIAERFHRTQKGVRDTWVASKEWKETVRVVGKIGLSVLYDRAGVEAFARERVWLPPEQTAIPANQLMTMAEIAEYTGIDYNSVTIEARNGRLGPPDSESGGIKRWTRESVDRGFWARKRRTKRAKTQEVPE